MKYTNKITPLIIGGTLSGAVALSLLFVGLEPQATQAETVRLAQGLAPEEINLRAKQIVVRIDGASVGSGSLIDRSEGIYTVLSNWHVIKNSGEFIVQTIDGRKHQVIADSIKKLPGVDLAILQFDSNQNYQVAELGDSSNISEGQNVYFAGYPGELRREDNRYYRFFTANLVGILPKSTENGYSLIYSGEAFPGMSGGPVFNRDGLMIGIHGEANINALSGGTSNYAIAIDRYQQAIAELKAQPETPKPTAEVAAEKPPTETTAATPQAAEQNSPEAKPEAEAKPAEETTGSLDADEISSVPTFDDEPPAEEVELEEVEVDVAEAEKPEAEKPPAAQPEAAEAEKPEAEEQPEATEAKKPPAEEEVVEVSTVTRKIPLISQRTGIDFTKLRNLLRDEKWSEADIHTYKLVGQVVKSAKRQNKRTFIELKTITEYSCPDLRTVDYLWKKYSNNKFGFTPQQEIWQSVNQKGDFSTQTWRRFATEVGWKKGEVDSGSGYLLYDQLDFEPETAPAGHLPWWFSLPDESQNVIKSLFSRCNLNPSDRELEAEAQQNSPDTAQNPNNSRDRLKPDVKKTPKR